MEKRAIKKLSHEELMSVVQEKVHEEIMGDRIGELVDSAIESHRTGEKIEMTVKNVEKTKVICYPDGVCKVYFNNQYIEEITMRAEQFGNVRKHALQRWCGLDGFSEFMQKRLKGINPHDPAILEVEELFMSELKKLYGGDRMSEITLLNIPAVTIEVYPDMSYAVFESGRQVGERKTVIDKQYPVPEWAH